MESRVRDDYRRNTGQHLADSPENRNCRGIVQRRKLGRVFDCADYSLCHEGWAGHVFTAMHDTMSDGIDSCGTTLAKPTYGADCGGPMVSDRLRLLELVAGLSAHADAAALSDFLESA